MTDATVSISPEAARRRAKLLDGLESLRTSPGVQRLLSERTLMVIGGVLAPMGVVLVLLGWLGAARTPYLFEQVPYLISGGLLGLGFCVLGGFFYFAHWITELVKEQRAQTAALIAAIESLRRDDELADAITTLSARVAELAPAAAPRTTKRRAAIR